MNTKVFMRILSLFLKLSVVGCVVAGILTSTGPGLMMSASLFYYFTIQSNIWIGAICLVFAVLEIIEWATKKVLIKRWLYLVKFMFTVSISLTMFVFWFMLAPTMPASYLATAGNLLCHTFSALFAIADYLVFDSKNALKKGNAWLATVMPIYYFIFSMICSVTGVVFADGGNVPYFFLNYSEFSWFGMRYSEMYKMTSIGVFYWFWIVVLIVLALGFGYYALNRVMRKTKLGAYFAQEKGKNEAV